MKKEAQHVRMTDSRNTAHVECESQSGTGTNRGDWDHFRITQTVFELHTGNARNYGTTENSHTGHCTPTVPRAAVKMENIFHGRNNITCGTNCKYRTAATVYTVETWFVSGTLL